MLLLRLSLLLNYNFLVIPPNVVAAAAVNVFASDSQAKQNGRLSNPRCLLMPLWLALAEMINWGIVKVMKNCCGRVMPFKMATNFSHFLVFYTSDFYLLFFSSSFIVGVLDKRVGSRHPAAPAAVRRLGSLPIKSLLSF